MRTRELDGTPRTWKLSDLPKIPEHLLDAETKLADVLELGARSSVARSLPMQRIEAPGNVACSARGEVRDPSDASPSRPTEVKKLFDVQANKRARTEPKVAVAQMEVKAGMPEHNVATMLRMIEDAKKQKCDVIVFPEMCVGGYMVGDNWRDDDYCAGLMRYNDQILAASKGIAVVWGNICLDKDLDARGIPGYHPNKDEGARRYNAVFVAQDGKWAERKAPKNGVKPVAYLPPGVHAKTLLPNYGLFHDEREFFSLRDVALDFNVPLKRLEQPFLIKLRGGATIPIGFVDCEDVWPKSYRMNGQAINATKMMIENGAKYVFAINASPWSTGKTAARDETIQFVAKDCGKKFVPFIYCAHVGVQNNGKNIVPFDGDSAIYDASGKRIGGASKPFAEELIIVESFKTKPVARGATSPIAEKYDALIKGIRHMQDLRRGGKMPKFIIGLSGGIDSAVSAALLVAAVGKENVIAVNMPTQYNKAFTKEAAKKLADNLGIEYVVAPIEELVEANRKLIQDVEIGGQKLVIDDLTEENIQAKTRGTGVLSNIAAIQKGVFTNNANKLEVALGYGTLYGDWGGAIGVLGDCLKVEVWELAKHVNALAGKEIIPAGLIPDEEYRFVNAAGKPSAELKTAQVDPMIWGYHDAMLQVMMETKKMTPDIFMRWFMDGTLHKELASRLRGLGIAMKDEGMLNIMQRAGVDQPEEFTKNLVWLCETMQNAIFKRVQSPPVIRTSCFAFGWDKLEAMAPFDLTPQAREMIATIKQRAVYAA